MNKKLMAAAVAGAFLTPALVYAQNATVQVYGRAFVEYGWVDQGDNRPKTDMLQAPGSNIGFKGQEQLGGGLAAWFQCESTADPRGLTQDGFCSRNSGVGLKGGFGNLFFGKWDTPMKRAYVGQVGVTDTGLGGFSFILAGNSTGTGALGGNPVTTAEPGQSLSRNAFKRRESGLIYYESPSFGGFQVLAAYSTANATNSVNDTVNDKPRVGSIAGTYSNGPLNIAAAYEKHWQFGGPGLAGQVGVAELDDKGWTIGASYHFFGSLLLGAQYTEMEFELIGGEAKKKTWFIGGDWNFGGPHHITGGYGQADDTKGGAFALQNTVTSVNLVGGTNAPITAGDSTGAKLWNIAYQYDLSKRTIGRVGYIMLDNDSRARYTLGGLGATQPTIQFQGEKQQAAYISFDHRW